jgi:glycosyltransferase involved in cell wall biosynthesis
MSTTLISCVIPVFNGEGFLLEAIKSVRSQHGVELEIIVVDDGSTDRSAELARSVPGVRVVTQSNRGTAAARNYGLRLARGELIAFHDADDIWLPGKLAAQLATLQANPQADYCITMVSHFAVEAGTSVPGEGKPMLGRLMPCLLAWRRCFDRVGKLYTGTTGHAEQDWFIRARELGLVEVLVPEVFFHRRIHGKNFSIVHDATLGKDWLAIARRQLERRRAAGLSTEGVERWTTNVVE